MAKSKKTLRTEIEFSRLMAGDCRMLPDEPKDRREKKSQPYALDPEARESEYAAFFCADGFGAGLGGRSAFSF